MEKKFLKVEDVPEYISRSNASFGYEGGYSKTADVEKSKKIGEYTLFLVSCFDSYEDGYCIFLCNNEDFNGYYLHTWNVVREVQYRGNSSYGSEYYNKYAGEKTFDSINDINDFEMLKEDRYFFLRCNK